MITVYKSFHTDPENRIKEPKTEWETKTSITAREVITYFKTYKDNVHVTSASLFYPDIILTTFPSNKSDMENCLVFPPERFQSGHQRPDARPGQNGSHYGQLAAAL